jgi:hypothetical protein
MSEDAGSRREAVRVALQELGEASAEMLSAFVARRFGLDVPPRLIPLIRASLESREDGEAQAGPADADVAAG